MRRADPLLWVGFRDYSRAVSTLLLVIALVVAALNLMLPVALLGWGLAGGDGRPDNPFYGGLALVIVLGGVYSLVECIAAFGGVGPLRWWLMWLLPVAAAVGCFLLRML